MSLFALCFVVAVSRCRLVRIFIVQMDCFDELTPKLFGILSVELQCIVVINNILTDLKLV